MEKLEEDTSCIESINLVIMGTISCIFSTMIAPIALPVVWLASKYEK
jgi:hypothetical protein